MIGTIGLTTSTADRKRRAGQRIIMGLAGLTPTQAERALIKEIQPGGFILFSRNVDEPAQVLELNRELAGMLPASFPPLRSVDQEGGRVQRIKTGATAWPPMLYVGNANSKELTRQLATAMALELRAMDFDLDFAPVADTLTNPQNPVIGDRAFGRTPLRVAEQLEAFIPAMQAQGLIACAKHFPGHGDTHVDSHLDLPVVEEDPDRMLSREIMPFEAAISAGVGSIMTAHVLYPAFDEDYPATMSERILQRILRKKLAYPGVVISDDLEMKAVRGRYPLEHQLEKATYASVDIFLACKEPELQHQCWETLVKQQEDDKANEKAAIESVKRIFRLRERFLKNRPPRPPLSVLGCMAHTELALRLRAEGMES